MFGDGCVIRSEAELKQTRLYAPAWCGICLRCTRCTHLGRAVSLASLQKPLPPGFPISDSHVCFGLCEYHWRGPRLGWLATTYLDDHLTGVSPFTLQVSHSWCIHVSIKFSTHRTPFHKRFTTCTRLLLLPVTVDCEPLGKHSCSVKMPVILWKQDTQISQCFWRLSILCQKSMHCHLPAVSDAELKTVHRDAISVVKKELYSCLNKLLAFPCCLCWTCWILKKSCMSLTQVTLDSFIL